MISETSSHRKALLQEERADYLSTGSLLSMEQQLSSGQKLVYKHTCPPAWLWISMVYWWQLHSCSWSSAQAFISEKTDLELSTLPKITMGEWQGLAYIHHCYPSQDVFSCWNVFLHMHSWVWRGVPVNSSDTAFSESHIMWRKKLHL